jgi:mRNA interferase RelE/StbE
VASYKLLIKPSAVKELEALPLKDRRRVVARVRGLSGTPRPPGCEKLSGLDLYRVRQGSYRILYAVQDAEHVVVIIKIGHRREVYR